MGMSEFHGPRDNEELTGRFQAGAPFEGGDFRASLSRVAPENASINGALVDVLRSDELSSRETAISRPSVAGARYTADGMKGVDA